MRARCRVRAEAAVSGGTRLTVLRSAPPLSLRPAADALYLVGSSAGPLGGDEVILDVEVGDGAQLTVRTVAASVALPGRLGAASRTHVRAVVGARARLRWLPEPLVAAAGCDHRATARIRLGAGGQLEWREELILGRHGETPGRCETALRVDYDGHPLLRHALRVGGHPPYWDAAGVVGGARAVGALALVGRPWAGAAVELFGPTAAVLPLPGLPDPRPPPALAPACPPDPRPPPALAPASPGVLVSVLAGDAPALRDGLDRGRRLAAAPKSDLRAPDVDAAGTVARAQLGP